MNSRVCEATPTQQRLTHIGRTSLLAGHDLILYIPLTAFRVAVLGYAAFQIALHAAGGWDWPALVLGLALLAPSFFDLAAWFSLAMAQRPSKMTPRAGLRVAAVTTFVPGSESLGMLERTAQALAAIDYPHESWILDEGDTADVRRLCDQYGIRHFSRKDRPEYNSTHGTFKERSKHGNYNAWLDEIGIKSYDIIAAFDPDHVPCREFLTETIGYFEDSGVGYVQAAQAYYNQDASFIARGAAEETYAYHSAVQMACWRSGYPIIVGCHNVHRTDALREAGGFAPHDADDLLLSIRYRGLGWQGVYVPSILARGLAPVDWAAYLGQQTRWARSVLDLKIRRPAVAGHAGWGTRALSSLQGARYFTDAGFAIGIVATVAAVLVTGDAARFFQVLLLAWLPLVVAAFCNRFKTRFYLDPERESEWPWRSYLLRAAKWPYTLAAAVAVLLNRQQTYFITPKSGKPQSGASVALPQLILSALIGLAWLSGTLRGAITEWPLRLLAAVAVAMPLALAGTARLAYPAAFDASLSAFRKVRAPARRLTVDLAGAAVAAFAFLWSLPGVQHGAIAWTDSARHAMNGACILDLFRSASIARPVHFASEYFNRLPAITMPYHPPLYPAFEAIVFAILGVNFVAARLALAFATALAVFLMFRLGLLLLRSTFASVCCCVALLSFGLSAWLARTVMLEFPAMVFTVASVMCLWRNRDDFGLGAGVRYGLIAACGIWTKQTVFLGLLPFAFFALTGATRAWKRAGVWVAAGICALSSGSLLLLGSTAGLSGVPHNWARQSLVAGLLHNLKDYAPELLAGAAAVCVVVALSRTRYFRPRFQSVSMLLVAWAISVAAVAVAVPAYDARYLFPALAPLLLVCCATFMECMAAALHRPQLARAVLAGAVVASFAWNGFGAVPYLSGPELVTRAVRQAGLNRVLYFGFSSGSFTFATREVNPDFKAVVIRGDRLPPRFFSPDGVAAAAKMLGIEAIVVEDTPGGKWSYLGKFPPKSASLWREFRQDSSASYLRGRLLVYRVENPTPATQLYRQPSQILGTEPRL